MPAVTANGIALHTMRFGAGDGVERPMVVFVHGLVLADLAGFYFSLAGTVTPVADVLLYDLRGHGRSQIPDSGYTVAVGVADLVALLDRLGIVAAVHLVANSYGAAIALTTAICHPERVASMMLIEGHYQTPGWGAEMADSLVMAGEHLDVESILLTLSISSRRKAARLGLRADRLIRRTTLLDDLRGEPALSLEAIRGIECPTLCCYGADSDLVERGRSLAGLVPGARYELFAGATHSLLVERTTELRALLRAWIAAPDDPVPRPVTLAADPR